MKKTRRFASLATAAILAACAVVPATMSALPVSAATPITSGSITITTEETDHHYKAYQIFDGSLSKDDNGAITFADVKWGSAFGTNGADPASVDNKTIYEALSALGIEKDGANVFAGATTATAVSEALAKLSNGDGVSYTDIDRVAAVFQKYLPANATGVENDTYTDDSYKIKITDPGYYLVVETSDSVADGEAISKYMLQVAGETTVAPKADAPQVMKKVKENTNYTGYNNQTVGFGQETNYALADNYNDVADYNIGDDVPFTLYGSLPTTFANYKGYYYQFTDKLSAGLTLNADSVTVTVTDKSGAPVVLNTSQYTLATTTDGFTVTINDLKTIDMDADTEGTQVMSDDAVITVDYTATLNAKAVIGLDGNPNEVFLTYSNDSNTAQGGDTDKTGKTPEDKVIVFTYEMDVTKYLDKAEDANKAAADAAGFKLYKKVGNDTYYAQLTDNKVTGWTKTEADATEIKTVAGGLVKFIGLDDGTFYLKETTTPTGYNTMEDLEVVVDATTANNQTWAGEASAALTNLSVSYGETNANGSVDTGSVPVSIINKSGSSLPSTGGIGTTIFYVAGGVLVVGAGVLLITKKRAKDAQ